MFWALPFHTVWQKQNDTAQSTPFVFRADDELIDNHLRRVAEVAKLRFPHHERVGIVKAVSILKAQHARL